MWGQDDDLSRRFSLHSELTCYQVDSAMRLKPAAFMDLAQEIAYQAATRLGFGYEALQKEGTAWVLSRLHFKFIEHPLWRDSFTLSTWHKGPSGPFYLRDFAMSGADGSVVVVGTSSWVIIDVVNRRMCRVSDIMERIPDSTICTEDAIGEPAAKTVMPRGSEPETVAVHQVEYSDVDFLGHTNNARYMVWAMDCIDYDELISHPAAEVSITFNHETHAGDKVILERLRVEGSDGGLTYYIEGKLADGRSAFCTKIVL